MIGLQCSEYPRLIVLRSWHRIIDRYRRTTRSNASKTHTIPLDSRKIPLSCDLVPTTNRFLSAGWKLSESVAEQSLGQSDPRPTEQLTHDPCRDLHGDGGWCCWVPVGMETNAAGLPRGLNKIVRDSVGNVAVFDFRGVPTEKNFFQTAERYLLTMTVL